MSDCANWFATIKWADNDQIETVPVSDIRKFNPTDLNSFQRDHWYRVKGAAKYFNDGQKHSAYALIGCLAESEADLMKRSSRIRFPPVPRPIKDPVSTNSEAEPVLSNTSQNMAVAVQQERAASQKSSKQKREVLMFKKFAAHHIENIPNDDSEDVATLKAQIQLLKKQLQQSSNPVQSPNLNIIEYLDTRLTAMESRIMKEMDAKVGKIHSDLKEFCNSYMKEGVDTLNQRTAAMENMLNARLPTTLTPSSTGRSSTAGDSILISDKWNYTMSTYSYRQMMDAGKESDWATALLRGVFGQQAELYRVYPRKVGLLKFPSQFLEMAKELFRDWYKKRPVEEDGPTEIELNKYVDSLPAYLADLAQNMAGSRCRKRTLNSKGGQSPKIRSTGTCSVTSRTRVPAALPVLPTPAPTDIRSNTANDLDNNLTGIYPVPPSPVVVSNEAVTAELLSSASEILTTI